MVKINEQEYKNMQRLKSVDLNKNDNKSFKMFDISYIPKQMGKSSLQVPFIQKIVSSPTSEKPDRHPKVAFVLFL